MFQTSIFGKSDKRTVSGFALNVSKLIGLFFKIKPGCVQFRPAIREKMAPGLRAINMIQTNLNH